MCWGVLPCQHSPYLLPFPEKRKCVALKIRIKIPISTLGEGFFGGNFVSSIYFGGKNMSSRCAALRNFSCHKPGRLGTTGTVRRRVYSNVVDP
jgi:hypothetical protein